MQVWGAICLPATAKTHSSASAIAVLDVQDSLDCQLMLSSQHAHAYTLCHPLQSRDLKPAWRSLMPPACAWQRPGPHVPAQPALIWDMLLGRAGIISSLCMPVISKASLSPPLYLVHVSPKALL